MRARYYSPAMGRFISADPVGARGGINLYAYANGNPTSLSDPMGTDPSGPNGHGIVPYLPLLLPLVGMAIAGPIGAELGELAAEGVAVEVAAEGVEASEIGINLLHGTDIESATEIVNNGLNVSSAIAKGGGDVFWATTAVEDANLFAAANPAGGIPAIVQVSIPNPIFDSLLEQGLVEINGPVYQFATQAWSTLNQYAAFGLLP